MIPAWLHGLSIAALVLGFLCAALGLVDAVPLGAVDDDPGVAAWTLDRGPRARLPLRRPGPRRRDPPSAANVHHEPGMAHHSPVRHVGHSLGLLRLWPARDTCEGARGHA